ncbi:MAG: type II toxin-antitoxin system RelE/ParE family toxin [Verrucomicrobia bacterium]|nr:type II toxin-antitoxin system RelE/ParE family toxin [Verrucomicrobiota bacterium]
MKKGLEITAYEIYRGSARAVVALSLGGSPPALEYLRNLEKSNKKGHDIIHGYFDSLSNEKEIHERATFKCLDRGRRLYEFRPSSLRLYCFLHEDTLIFLTNGGTKNNKKEQNQDIQKAKALQDEFHRLLKLGASITIRQS